MKKFFMFRHIILLLQFVLCILLLLPGFVSAGSVTYQYDARHRLTGAIYDNGVTVAYTYDAAGNRLTETITANDAAASSSTKLAMVLQNAMANKQTNGKYLSPFLTQENNITKTALGFTKTIAKAGTFTPYDHWPYVMEVSLSDKNQP